MNNVLTNKVQRACQLLLPCLCNGVIDQRTYDVEHDYGRKTGEAEDAQQSDRGESEGVAQGVAVPAEVLEFEGEHRYLCHEQPARNQRAAEEAPKQQGVGRVGGQGLGQRAPEEGVGRRGQSDKSRLLPLVEVELGKAQGRESRDEEGGVGQIG